MPDPYTITLTQAAENINNTPDTYQLILIFTVDLSAANQAHTFAAKSLLILDHGKTKWAYRMEDNLVSPQSQGFVISDPTGYLRGLLMGTSSEQVATRKQFDMNLKLNGTSVFQGRAVEDGMTCELIESTAGSYVVKFTAFPIEIEAVFKKNLYTATGVAVNPFSYTTGVHELLTDIIDDIWQLMNAGITVDYNQHWLFQEAIPGVTNIPFAELGYFPTEHFFDGPLDGIETCGDLLKRYCLEFGCFTGIKDYDNAFFTQLFFYDSGSTQSLGKVHRKIEGYIWNLLYYVQTTVLGSATIRAAGTYTKAIENQNLIITDAMASVVEDATTTSMDESKEAGGSYQLFGNTISEFWFNNRGDITVTRTDEFLVDGVTYDFTKHFTHDSFKYQIIEMEINWKTGQTNIKALNLGT